MRKSARKFKAKAKRLMQLYSLWQETRREDLQHKCMGLLGEILDLEPGFSLRREFQAAF
jgi:hypothetical protein